MCMCWERSGLSHEHWAYLYYSRALPMCSSLLSADGATLKA